MNANDFGSKSVVYDTDEVLGKRGNLHGAESRWTYGIVKDWIALTFATNAYVDSAVLAVGGGAVASVAGRTGIIVLTKADVGLSLVANTADSAKPISTLQQAALDLKAALVHTHTASQISDATAAGVALLTAATAASQKIILGVTQADVGLSLVDNTSDEGKPISAAQATAIATRAALVHTHTASDISDATVAGRSMLTAASAAAQKTLLALSKADVGLSLVDNTTDLTKPLSTADIAALAGKAPTSHSHAATDIISGVLAADRLATGTGLQVVRRNAGNTALEFATISVGGGDMLGTNNLSDLTVPATARTNLVLGNVDNTSDAAKPVSTAQAAAIALKAALSHTHSAADITSGTLDIARLATGTGLQVFRRNAANTAGEFATISVGGGDMLGTNNLSDLTVPATARTNLVLGNVNNTSDAAKPISTLTQAALDAKAALSHTHTASEISDSTAAGRALLTAANLAAQKTALAYTTADIADSTNKRYVTDANLTLLAATSGANTGDQTTISGNAATATVLQTARTINGTSFNGSANITVTAAGSTLTGTSLAAGIVSSSLTSAAGGSFGTAAFTASSAYLAAAGTAASATILATARLINGVSFNGSANISVPAGTTGTTLALSGALTAPSATLTDLIVNNNTTISQTLNVGAVVAGSVASGVMSVNNVTASNRWLYFKTSGAVRWGLLANATSEGGSNAGSDFNLYSFDDAGAIKELIYQTNRSSGVTRYYNATASTSPSTGAMVLDGGLGVAGNVNVGGAVNSGAVDMGTTTVYDKLLLYHSGNAKYGLGIISDGSMRAFISSAGTKFSWGTMATSDGTTYVEKASLTGSGDFYTSGAGYFGTNVTADNYFMLRGASGTDRYVFWCNASGLGRWGLRCNGTAESGSSAGSDMELYAFNDAGSPVVLAYTVTRATGNVAFAGTVSGLVAGTGLASDQIGFRGVPQAASFSANFTVPASYNGKSAYHPGSDTTARTVTIDSNASLALPVGFTFTLINDSSAGVLTIAITTDTQVLAGAGTTGSRTLAANGIATWTKTTSTRWMCSGNGLT